MPPQTGVARPNNGLRAVGNLQFAEDLGDVIADRLAGRSTGVSRGHPLNVTGAVTARCYTLANTYQNRQNRSVRIRPIRSIRNPFLAWRSKGGACSKNSSIS